MYTQSINRQASAAVVLVATLAGIVAAGTDGGYRPGRADRTVVAGSQALLPLLPEVVVTASRLES